jgi:hypothetical protein
MERRRPGNQTRCSVQRERWDSRRGSIKTTLHPRGDRCQNYIQTLRISRSHQRCAKKRQVDLLDIRFNEYSSCESENPAEFAACDGLLVKNRMSRGASNDYIEGRKL